MRHRACLAFLLVLYGGVTFAQTSPGYRLTEEVFNAGGNPTQGTILSSTSFRITLDSIGDALPGGASAGPSFRLTGGFLAAYPPPGEVRNLRLTDTDVMTWDRERSAGSYNVYRGTIADAAGFGVCFQASLPAESTPVPETPAPGTGYFYLVTAKNRLNEEGTKGVTSTGAMRLNDSPCP